MDPVFVRPPGLDPGGFVLTPRSVWYCWVLLLFSASTLTDTGSKSFDCVLVSTLEPLETSGNGNYCDYCNYCNIVLICTNFLFSRMVGIYRLSDSLRARPQETNSLCFANWKYPWQACPSSCWRHRNYSFQHAQTLAARNIRQQEKKEVGMAARCGMLIRGQWDGPVTSEYCDEMGWNVEWDCS